MRMCLGSVGENIHDRQVCEESAGPNLEECATTADYEGGADARRHHGSILDLSLDVH